MEQQINGLTTHPRPNCVRRQPQSGQLPKPPQFHLNRLEILSARAASALQPGTPHCLPPLSSSDANKDLSELRYSLSELHVIFTNLFKMVEAAAPKVAKAKKPAKKAEHPPSAVMVLAAVKALKESKGSSLAAIKKYIAANNKVLN